MTHPYPPAVSFDGGDLDCGNGLLLLIRKHIDPLPSGGLLEIISSESSVKEDLPAWCRLTGNELVSEFDIDDRRRSYLVSKGRFVAPTEMQEPKPSGDRKSMPLPQPLVDIRIPDRLPPPVDVPEVAPLAVMGIGSWPRPQWMLRTLHAHLEGRADEDEFREAGDAAVRLAVEAQLRAGVDVVTDGEQRRDNYSSFVGGLLDNCQLIPLTDLLPYVDHPNEFARELDSLDVPAKKVRHPAVFGRLGRSRPLGGHEFEAVRLLTQKPVKVALPGPYLLTRTMWMECISDRAYEDREELARDVVRVLREELHFLLAAGVALVQFDEPVLTEVVHGGSADQRTFMCGALGEKLGMEAELEFAQTLIGEVMRDLPSQRLALHVCRGNWTPDESAALSGDYEPLRPLLCRIPADTLFLEFCTPRAGRMDILRKLPESKRVGVGVVNPKVPDVESVDQIVANAKSAIDQVGEERVLLVPDCGFATFADNPITSASIAEQKLAAIVQAKNRLRSKN